MKFLSTLAISLLWISGNILYAQEKCATVQYNQLIEKKVPIQEYQKSFEKWIEQKKIERRLNPRILSTKDDPLYIIPVVIHVIYYTDSQDQEVGNIAEEQILSQINVLNEDYRRMNYDTIYTPEIFKPVATDARIEFRLAQRDPNGAPTTGIVRVEGPQSSWNANSTQDDILLKSISFWPPEDYLNIWVVNLSGDFLGYAQYPITDLPGSLPPFNRDTDGVVIDYEVFGSVDKGPFPNIRLNYDRGRTTTHEVGHFLGLRHIWGDSDQCGATDYCDDTPDQETSYSSCTNILGFSCDSDDMYQNYMDYTYDACMNIFTGDQKERMRIILENSPRRASLLNSPGLLPPDTIPNILIIREILSPKNISCEQIFNPEVVVQNIGSNQITNFEIKLSLDDQVFPIIRYDVSIATGESKIINLTDEIGLVELEKKQYELDVLILNPNGIDTLNYPKKRISNYFVSSATEDIVPLREEFTDMDIENSDWVVYNPDNSKTWEVGSVPVDNKINNAVYIKMFDYLDNEQEDWLISPVLDFSDAPDPNLTFFYSYARSDPQFQDLLEILVSVDCGESFPFTVYSANSNQLAVRDFINPWVPLVSYDWRREYVNLSSFTGLNNVRIAFKTTNGNGNNLYIDDVEFHVTGFSESILLEKNSLVIHPNPSTNGSFYVTMNADNRQPVDFFVFNAAGKRIMDKRIELALNQTIEFDLIGYKNGIYLIKVIGPTFNKSAKVILHK